MKKESIIIIGGGGHAKVVIDLIESVGQYKILGIVDGAFKTGSKVLNYEVLGSDDLLPDLLKDGIRFAALGIGSWGDNQLRENIYKRVTSLGFKFPTLIHARAYVSAHAKLSHGVQVMSKACVQPSATIGENSVVNTATIVEHDCILGSHVYTGSNVILSGKVIVKDSAFIGSGACVIPEMMIGTQSLVAAGAVVVEDVKDYEKVKGVPAKSYMIKSHKAHVTSA